MMTACNAVVVQRIGCGDQNYEQESPDMGQSWPIESKEFSAEMTDLLTEAIEIANRNGFTGSELRDSVWRHLMVEAERHFAKSRE